MKPLVVKVALLLATVGPVPALAAPITITDPFMNLESRAINSLGFTPGQFFRIGATSVTPNGSGGTTGLGTTTSLATGLPVSRTIDFNPGPIIPNFFSRNLASDASLLGPWTLRFTNGPDTRQAIVSLPAGQAQAPFISTIRLSGTSAAPTFSWTPPAGATVNGYRINIYDKSLASSTSNGQVASRNVLPSVTSYTVSPADFTVPGYAFQLGRNYSIEIGLIQTKDGTSTNLSNLNLAAISRVYADFRPTSGPGVGEVQLPVVLPDGSFQFNFEVVAGQTYFLDPPVAIGYDYRTGAGNPSFRSVVLPSGIGDNLYDIFSLDGGTPSLLVHNWLAGAIFDFGAAGVRGFSIGGIEASAGLDPADVTAFVTGVTFVGSGIFTGTQTPIVFNVSAIPEPENAALLLAGLAALGAQVRRRRRRHG